VWHGCPSCPTGDPRVPEKGVGCLLVCNVCEWTGPLTDCWKRPANPLAATGVDSERESKLDAERVSLEFKSKSTRRLDAGTQPITDSPLFAPDGPAQGGLFE